MKKIAGWQNDTFFVDEEAKTNFTNGTFYGKSLQKFGAVGDVLTADKGMQEQGVEQLESS